MKVFAPMKKEMMNCEARSTLKLRINSRLAKFESSFNKEMKTLH